MRFVLWFLSYPVLMLGVPLLAGAISQGVSSKEKENRNLREPTLWRTRSDVHLTAEAVPRQSKPAPTHTEPKPAPIPQPTQALTSRPTRAPAPLPTQAPTPAPTARRTSAPTREPTASMEGGALRSNPSLLVGAYYYPWYLDDFHGGGYLREKLQPQQLPMLGEYNDRDVNTTRQHLEWCMGSNIFLWAMSWFGPDTRTDETSKIIMNYMESQSSVADFRVSDFKVAMLYEIPSRVRLNSNTGQYDTGKVKSDIEHLASNYFSRPNYLLIDDKPVVYVYLTRLLFANNILDEVIALMRAGANNTGYPEIYIVGDHAFSDPSNLPAEYPPFALLDAVTNYDVYGSMKKSLYAGNQTVQQYYDQQKVWSDKAKAEGCDFIPSSTPGFSNVGFKNGELGMNPMSRRLTQDAEEGSLFEMMLIKAKELVDHDAGNIMMITSFNEYHEDTQIEPVHVSSSSESTTWPTNVTYGLEYVAYGTLYLDLVKNITQNNEI